MVQAHSPQRRALIVLGMHRSGTSAVARCLNLLGAGIGERLIPANWGNETGFWEDEDVVEADKAILAAAGRTWHDVRPMPEGWAELPSVRDAARAAAAIIAVETAKHPLWVVKDPRLSRLLPAWEPGLAAAGCEPSFVICVRSPVEVAASQARRDGFSAERSNLLWLRHVLEAERLTRGRPRAVVRYDALLADWRSTLDRVGSALGIDWPVSLDAAAPAIEAFLRGDLRHFSEDDATLRSDRAVCAWAREVYGAMAASIEGPSDGAADVLDRVAAELDRADRVFSPVLGDLVAELAEARAAIDSEHAGWTQALEQLRASQGDLERARAGIDRARVEIVALNRAREAAERSRSAAEARFAARIGQLVDEVEGLRARRAVRLIDRFHPPGDLSGSVAPAFQQLLDDSRIFGPDLRGWALGPSRPLRGAALEYPLEVGGRSLAGVSLAVVVDAPIAAGTLEVELVALDGAVLRRAALAATELREEAPTRFRFDGVAPDRRGRLVLRVSAIGVDAPLRIFEWSRRGLRGLGPRHSRAFCGFEFAVPAGAGVKQAQERRGEV